MATPPRYDPIKLRGNGPSASEIIIAVRRHDRLGMEERLKAALEPKKEQPPSDKDLLDAVQAEGFDTWNPCD
jgi:hypothetical protein